MSHNPCSVCTAENVEELEELGRLVLAGEISWRESARRGGLNHYKKLQNHMARHYVSELAVEENRFENDVEAEVLETQRLLLEKSKVSPPEVRPMYLAAIYNLGQLAKTRPSQSVLVQALKTATEMTGMKMEQQLMLEFAQAAFGADVKPSELPGVDPATQLDRAFSKAEVIDV